MKRHSVAKQTIVVRTDFFSKRPVFFVYLGGNRWLRANGRVEYDQKLHKQLVREVDLGYAKIV